MSTTTLTITPTTIGVDSRTAQKQSSADMINALLTKNHADFHLYFNKMGFHNHIAHYMLTIYALGATPEQMKQAFEMNASFQKPQYPISEESIAKMEDPGYLHSLFGKEENYHDLVTFFERRIARDGWQNVATEFVFSGSRIAEDMMVRMYAGIWHPMILFGFGIEFEQPVIVAEGLAEAACHGVTYLSFLRESERLAGSTTTTTPLVELVRQIKEDRALRGASHWRNMPFGDEKNTGDAPDRMLELAAQWRVQSTDELAYRTAEMININAWIAGAAQRRDKQVQVDFIFMHQVTVSIFFSAFNKQTWIPDAAKIRMLEWQTRVDLLQYAAALAPPLLTDEITNYEPVVGRGSEAASWAGVTARINAMLDDGHAAKMVRALAHGRDVCAPFEAADARKPVPELPIKGDMWLQLANIVIDSTSRHEEIRFRWVRGAGHDAAWNVVPDREAK